MRYWRVLFAVMLLAGALLGCAPAAVPLQDLGLTAPWQDGEESYYNVEYSDGTQLGAAVWRWHKTDGGWLQSYEVTMIGRTDKGETTLDASLQPVSAWSTVGDTRYEAQYLTDHVLITSTIGATVTANTLARDASTLDNDQTLQTQRALPFAAGLSASYLNIIPTSASSAATRVSVDGPVTVTVPAGEFSAWHVKMSFGTLAHEAWYSVDAPKLLLRYTNTSAGTSFVLRAWRAAGGAALQGSSEAASAPSEGEVALPEIKMNWPYMLLALLVQVPVMIGISLLVGWQINKRLGISWNVFLYGAITFVISQVVHLVINQLVGLAGSGSTGAGSWPLLVTALVAGASAGLSEQGANWLALRFVWRKFRSFAEGLQFGAGHGAVEAIIAGLLSLATLVNIIMLYSSGIQELGLSADQSLQAVQAFSQVLNTPLYMPLLAALERVSALAVQMLMAVLVMQSLAKKKPLLWFAAFGLHTLLDAWAVYGQQTVGVVLTELGLLVIAAFSVWQLWRMHKSSQNALAF
ncbi:MAG: YhfC family intramembrane metalloprotease [Chloroflexi bacterium]|nr:YhfC family intramembrane metalloprotease [Chloroflexota bacterium]